ncbi:hypothetical protein ACA910_005651 [Epithemia clementina (nom. ined.)]
MMNSRATLTSKKGIDISVAMEILSQRQRHQHDHNNDPHRHHHDTSDQHAGCDGCGPRHGGGQVIDLFPSTILPTTTSPQDSHDQSIATEGPATKTSGQMQQGEQQPPTPQAKDDNKLDREVSRMSTREKIQLVLKSQEDRVITYRCFDEGLRDVLTTGNMTLYPALCAQVTATFAVLSDTINTVRNNPSTNSELKQLLKQLQQHEREKLNSTAALHLEQMRKASSDADSANTTERDNTSSQMLESGIASLRVNIATCIESINQVLEELRFLLLDAEDEP